MRILIAIMYAMGALLTAVGVLLAFKRARGDLRQLEEIGDLHESHDDPDLVELYEESLADDTIRRRAREARERAERQELHVALTAAGLDIDGLRLKDMRLPADYYAKRSALRDAVASFKTGGLVALFGLLLSTVASICSLYL